VGVPEDTGPSWRVAPSQVTFKAAGAVVFVLAGLLFGANPVQVGFALIAAAALAAYGLRDLIAPVRVAADAAAVTVVTGYASRRRIPWAQVERVRVDVRRRFGTRSELLEIDTGDTLHLYSAYELNAPCADVAAELNALRSAAVGG
jgi:hypothetical protein